MAVTIDYKEDSRKMFPLKYVANMFLDQTIEQIQRNLETQHVWPTEIYPNFHSINEIRKRHKQWYATGEGAKSFDGTIVEADESTGIVTMSFRYNDYMQYVDIGVGAVIKEDNVDRGKKVKFSTRYSKWFTGNGKTHRPAIMPELRHLATRLEDYCSSFYGRKFEFEAYETFDGLTIFV